MSEDDNTGYHTHHPLHSHTPLQPQSSHCRTLVQQSSDHVIMLYCLHHHYHLIWNVPQTEVKALSVGKLKVLMTAGGPEHLIYLGLVQVMVSRVEV